jgi:hypothetical protein
VHIEAFDKVTTTRRPEPDRLPGAAAGSRRWNAEHTHIQREKAAGISGKLRKAGGLFVIDIVPAPKTNVLGPTFGLQGVETMPLEIFDAGIAIMQGIPELEPLILTAMFWPEKPKLAAPDKNDAGVKRSRDAIAEALKEARAPLEEYIATLQPLQKIIDIDVEAVIKEWQTKKPEEIAIGLKSFQSKKDSMEERIPVRIYAYMHN